MFALSKCHIALSKIDTSVAMIQTRAGTEKNSECVMKNNDFARYVATRQTKDLTFKVLDRILT